MKQSIISNKPYKCIMSQEFLVIRMLEMLLYKRVIQCIVLLNVIEHYIIWIYAFNILEMPINTKHKN